MDIIGGCTPKTEYWNGNMPCRSVKDFKNAKRFLVFILLVIEINNQYYIKGLIQRKEKGKYYVWKKLLEEKVSKRKAEIEKLIKKDSYDEAFMLAEKLDKEAENSTSYYLGIMYLNGWGI